MKKKNGFTFIEVILVVALMLILGTSISSFGSRLFNQNSVGNVTDQLINEFRKAQLYAMMGKQGSNWGINYASNTITLYKGASFATRTSAFDETFTVNTGTTITGLTEINFARITGLPTPTSASITISANGSSKTITMNVQGVVTR